VRLEKGRLIRRKGTRSVQGMLPHVRMDGDGRSKIVNNRPAWNSKEKVGQDSLFVGVKWSSFSGVRRARSVDSRSSRWADRRRSTFDPIRLTERTATPIDQRSRKRVACRQALQFDTANPSWPERANGSREQSPWQTFGSAETQRVQSDPHRKSFSACATNLARLCIAFGRTAENVEMVVILD